MALTGIEIFKLLAKTNCKECGFPTCLAFAMALASGKAELDKCPYVSDEVREKLAAASAPPIRPIKIGMKEGAKTVGGETVMFRHEKTFFNPTLIAGLVTTAQADGAVDKQLDSFMKLQFDRVGLLLRPELIAVQDVSGDAGKFAALVKKVMDKTDAGLILCGDKADVIKAGAKTTLYGHACEVETSVGLYLAPQAVKPERVAGEVSPYAHAYTDIKSEARLNYPFMFEELTANGALGDARLATFEFGQTIVETTLERTLEFLQSFLLAE